MLKSIKIWFVPSAFVAWYAEWGSVGGKSVKICEDKP